MLGKEAWQKKAQRSCSSQIEVEVSAQCRPLVIFHSNLSKSHFMELALCTGTLSRWNRFGSHSSSEEEFLKLHHSKTLTHYHTIQCQQEENGFPF